jgi:hypothetical protein
MLPTQTLRTRHWLAAGSTLALCACQAVLGIDDVNAGKQLDAGASAKGDAASAGSGASGSAAGSGTHATAGRGAGSAGGAAGMGIVTAGTTGITSAGTGGSKPNTAGSGGNVAGASGPTAGTGTAGTGTAGGGAPTALVHGKVIDFRHHPVPSVSVAIGQTTVMTNAQGEFEFADVAATYDAVLSVSISRNNVPKRSAWLYAGLTRRDPTLQVYDGLADRFAHLTVHTQNVDFANLPNQIAMVSFGGVDGRTTLTVNQTETMDYANWFGPDMTQGTVHALRMERDANTSLPTKYLAHAQQAVAFTDAGTTEVTFDLASSNLTTGLVTGTVTGPGQGRRSNFADLHFTDGTAMTVAIDDSAQASFSYLLPNLPNASVAVLASEGQLYPVEHESLPFSLARVVNVVPGQSGVNLQIPTAAVLSSPATNASNLNGESVFAWTLGGHVAVLGAELGDFKFYVVTKEAQAKLPVFPISAVSLPANAKGTWHVETHGAATTVDEAAGPDGFLDPDAFFLDGPPGAAGSFTLSEKRAFQSAP